MPNHYHMVARLPGSLYWRPSKSLEALSNGIQWTPRGLVWKGLILSRLDKSRRLNKTPDHVSKCIYFYNFLKSKTSDLNVQSHKIIADKSTQNV